MSAPDEPIVDAADLRVGDRLWTGGQWEEVAVDAVEREGVVYVGTLRDGQPRARTFRPGEQVRALRADVRHPAWCDPDEHTDEYHRSAPVVIEARRLGEPDITVRLLQVADEPLDTAPQSVLVTFDTSALLPLVVAFDLEPWQARSLVTALRRATALLRDGGSS